MPILNLNMVTGLKVFALFSVIGISFIASVSSLNDVFDNGLKANFNKYTIVKYFYLQTPIYIRL